MAIDRERIAADLATVPVSSERDGLFDVFGVPICRLPADLWLGFAQRLAGAVGPELAAEAEELLVEAARESGYHLAYGIVTSEAWQRVVAPQVERPPLDTLKGACAMFAACGWPAADIVEFVPGRRLRLRTVAEAGDSGSAVPGRDGPRATLLRGMAAALMDLAYSPQAYPEGMGTFRCERVAGTDHAAAEFVVTRV